MPSEEREQIEDLGICEPHWERANLHVPAAKVITGTPMCLDCWSGVPLPMHGIVELAEPGEPEEPGEQLENNTS